MISDISSLINNDVTFSGEKTFNGTVVTVGQIVDNTTTLYSAQAISSSSYGLTVTYAHVGISNGKINVVIVGNIVYNQTINDYNILAFVLNPDLYNTKIMPAFSSTILCQPFEVFTDTSVITAGFVNVRERYDSSISNHAYDHILRGVTGLTEGETYGFRVEYNLSLGECVPLV